MISLAILFSGSWRLDRHIRDFRTGRHGGMRGTALFTPEAEFLRYEETGLMVLGEFRGEARRDYRFHVEGDGAFSVFFADGAFFHRADLSPGVANVSHDCAPDAYRGRYRVMGPAAWTLSWRISGPRKDLLIGTRFSR